MKIMITAILLLTLGGNFYVLFRLWHLIPVGSPLRPALVVFGAMAVLSFFLVFLLGSKFPLAVTSFLHTVGTSWFFIVLYLLMAFLLLDLTRLFGVSAIDRFLLNSWTGFAVLTALMAVIFTGGYIRYLKKDRVELDITLPAGKVLERPLKIVALSDLHLGYGIGPREFSGWVERINAEKPDLVLLCGDVVDNSLRPLLEQDLASVFRRIESTCGVYAALGNHEYIAGTEESTAFLERAGVVVLRDSAALAGGVYVVGRDDRSNRRRKGVPELVGELDPSRAVILLDHQPPRSGEVSEEDATLRFSGHTHRGQVWPVSWITDGMYELSHGHRQRGDHHVYVSSGMGLWGGKFRIGTRSEYVVIRLEPAVPTDVSSGPDNPFPK